MSPTPLSRRQLLIGGFLGAGGLVAAGCASSTAPPRPTTTTTTLPDFLKKRKRPTIKVVDGVPINVAPWLIEENKKPGTFDWILTNYPPSGQLEGFTSATSANTGASIEIMVSTTDASFIIQAYRMGYYNGRGGRLIATSPTLTGAVQPPAIVDQAHGTVSCPWTPSWTADLSGWPPGFYMFKLTSKKDWQQWIPFCVRDDSSDAAFVAQSAVTTYQAYNTWGGWSLYQDDSGSMAKRASIVSFDRPYIQTWEQGSADFFGNEFPVIYDMERYGLDMTYWTDVDLDLRGASLPAHRSLISLGHDEYWSTPMRDNLQTAVLAGTNAAFLGANAIYRKVRFSPSSFGPDRLMTCYKSTADPVTLTDPAASTVNWESPPVNLPASLITGSTYISINANDNGIVTDPEGWWWKGTGATEGQVFPGLVRGEYNRFVPGYPGPQNVQLFAHSPIEAQKNFSDITYVTFPKGGGVLSTGSASFVNMLGNATTTPAPQLNPPIPGVTPVLLRAMLNLYGLFGAGPASVTMPSQTNWQQYYR